MLEKKIIAISGSNSTGGAEIQLCNLLKEWKDYNITLVFFSNLGDLGTFEKFKSYKNIFHGIYLNNVFFCSGFFVGILTNFNLL